jgi:hypothetical protein
MKTCILVKIFIPPLPFSLIFFVYYVQENKVWKIAEVLITSEHFCSQDWFFLQVMFSHSCCMSIQAYTWCNPKVPEIWMPRENRL